MNAYAVTVHDRTHLVLTWCALRACELAEARWGSWPERIERLHV
jgi:hypothetical protein